MGWGRPPSCECGACDKCKRAAYAREWYRAKSLDERRAIRAQRDRERVREADRARYHEKQKHNDEIMRRRRAVCAVNNAIRDGRLVRGACESCGAGDDVQGHHDDYDKPLDVRWLCTVCHAAEHAPEARAA